MPVRAPCGAVEICGGREVNMRKTSREEATAIIAIAGVVISLIVVRNAGSWFDAVREAATRLATDPLTIGIVVALVLAATAAVIARVVLTRIQLRDRISFALLPADSFDPPIEAVVRFASQLARVRGGFIGWLTPHASVVRIVLDSLPGGRMLYRIECPRRALPVLRAAVAAYGDVELRDPASVDPAALAAVVGPATHDEEVRSG
jgi:hypothetical protein